MVFEESREDGTRIRPEEEGSLLKWKGGEDGWGMQITWRQKGGWKVKGVHS